ncbi:MAG: hypothetical protein Q9163_000408 [Psora crenata]
MSNTIFRILLHLDINIGERMDYTLQNEAQEPIATEPLCHTSTSDQESSKSPSAWDAVKTNLPRRPSLKRVWRRWSRSSVTESKEEEQTRKSHDDYHGLFCDALLDLMQRTGRFEYLDYSKDHSTERRETTTDIKTDKPERKRFSWSK